MKWFIRWKVIQKKKRNRWRFLFLIECIQKINEDSVMVYDECVIYEDVDEKYNIWIYFKNGNININTLNIRDEENKQSIKASRENTRESIIEIWDIFT